MAGTHWSDDDLLDRLYGIGREDGHLETCRDCRQRWLELQETRQLIVSSPELPPDWLAGQRQRIWDRIEKPARAWWRPLAPAAMALTLGLAVMLQTPTPAPQPTVAQSDAALFEDVFQQVQQTAPDSLTPVQGLFEVTQ